MLRADPKTTADQYDNLFIEATKAEIIVVAAFVKRAAGKGTVALPERQAEFVRRLILSRKPAAVVAFSGPYLVRQFPEAAALLVAYGIEDVVQDAAARVLFGDVPARGRLPVTVPGLFAAGAGIQTKTKNDPRRAVE